MEAAVGQPVGWAVGQTVLKTAMAEYLIRQCVLLGHLWLVQKGYKLIVKS